MKKVLIEVCCGSFEDCLIAESAGADRIELNTAVFLGGLTPSLGCLVKVKENVKIPVIPMIRPREAGFYYSDYEYAVMKHDAEVFIKHGADGLVFGFLNANGSFNRDRMYEFTRICLDAGKDAVCHRSFDVTPDPYAALDLLIELGVTRVLTSGQQPTAIKGVDLITDLIKYANERIEILPGAGLNHTNLVDFIKKTGADQVHFSANVFKPDPSTSGKPNIHFGSLSPPRDDGISVTDENKLQKNISVLS